MDPYMEYKFPRPLKGKIKKENKRSESTEDDIYWDENAMI